MKIFFIISEKEIRRWFSICPWSHQRTSLLMLQWEFPQSTYNVARATISFIATCSKWDWWLSESWTWKFMGEVAINNIKWNYNIYWYQNFQEKRSILFISFSTLNLAIHFPEKFGYKRRPYDHSIKVLLCLRFVLIKTHL